MHLKIVPIGNSYGVKIPKTILSGLHIKKEVELQIENGAILLRLPKNKPRVEWEKSFRLMTSSKDDKLLEGNTPTEFDNNEWKW